MNLFCSIHYGLVFINRNHLELQILKANGKINLKFLVQNLANLLRRYFDFSYIFFYYFCEAFGGAAFSMKVGLFLRFKKKKTLVIILTIVYNLDI